MKRIAFTAALAVCLAGFTLGPGSQAFAASGGATSLALTGGSLTVTGAAPGTFSGTLTGANEALYSTLSSYTVTDATGSGAGWNVTFQAGQFTCVVNTDTGCKTGLTTLPTGVLLIAPPSAACASGSTCTGSPTVSISSNTAVDVASPVKVLSAATNTGMGSYTVTPGTISTGQLEVDVPGNALATTYHSTLTVTVNSTP